VAPAKPANFSEIEVKRHHDPPFFGGARKDFAIG